MHLPLLSTGLLPADTPQSLPVPGMRNQLGCTASQRCIPPRALLPHFHRKLHTYTAPAPPAARSDMPKKSFLSAYVSTFHSRCHNQKVTAPDFRIQLSNLYNQGTI